MILVLDHGGAFTGSLVQLLGTTGAEVEVLPAGAVTVEALAARAPAGVVLSSGPGHPGEAGVSSEAVRRLSGRVPILGVGLGHLVVAEAFGARVVPAARLAPGRTSPILHRGRGIFAGLDDPFDATRYDALTVERASLPAALETTAWTPESEIMGVKHHDHETWGVQFHPESVLTLPGLRLVENFLTLCRQHKGVSR